MKILVLNCGSSSLKVGVFEIAEKAAEIFKATYDKFAAGSCFYKITKDGAAETGKAPFGDIAAVLAALPEILDSHGVNQLEAVGHRIVHGGEKFRTTAVLDEATITAIDALTPLAPLHNPANLLAVGIARRVWPDLPQVAVFDTAFHATNPPRATTYAVPKAWRDAGLRRFGFHGTSHKYVAMRAADEIGEPLRDLQIVSVHLGNGASVCAVNRGESIDTSMGMTPLEGLVMGTRSGDVDPGLFGFLSRQLSLSIAEIEDALYSKSGLLGLTGSSDMRDVEERASGGDAEAQLAIELFAYRARKYIGAYAAAMGGLDAVVFTGGIGENSPSMRRRICDGLEFMGLRLDHDRNQSVDLTSNAAPQIQAYGARVRVIVTETAEQLMIARETAGALVPKETVPEPIPVAVSARHVHLSRAAVETLFGAGYRLMLAVPLRQPGQWAASERVTLEGPKGRLERVAILGPERLRTQIEISRTDGFALGIDAPVRDSGKLDGTPTVRLIGPAGSLTTDGLIVAARQHSYQPG
ncbi:MULTISPECIES: acetate/propionate family kinase [Sinorhizobium]|uniref:acetate/propionate family kinase n=1 Tax=Sinorhizobium TaxID=28105 RepID=UPI0002E4777C|nr:MULTISPECIES: acetate/propionate family kinase [Sinorhizobium]MDE3765486.1 acetate/propionate family kinase [Sinorhizobium meliloti]MDE3779248.1 acetate/propionate family kinase [Sinorhizobium meliloti]MDE3804795.1 acetate/propionate family kinase [Sinorhizobium meliloti]WQO55118.1 acetate/propionate family kinase [Sinorhizobium medicae]WQP06666.1 acetate/propionate family kinase [Sinorhizobium meliloti]